MRAAHLDGNLGREARWLIDTIAHGLKRQRGNEGVGAVLERLAVQDLSAVGAQPTSPRRLTACRHLPALLGELMTEESALAAAIADVEDSLCWRQNPNYSDEVMGQAGYMDNYAYAELIGPSGLFRGDDFLLGLMILGPGLHYCDHFHAAPELYWLLAGFSEWRSGIGDFAPRAAGETIWHPPFVPHATRTNDTPMLAAWVWTSDVATPAKLLAA
jgi:hypothetical protein